MFVARKPETTGAFGTAWPTLCPLVGVVVKPPWKGLSWAPTFLQPMF